MGLDLPGNSRDLVPFRTVHAVRRATPRALRWPVVVALVGAVALSVLVLESGGSPGLLPLIAAPFLAATTWGSSAQRSRARARAAYWMLAAAAALAVVALLEWAHQATTPGGTPGWTPYLILLPCLVAAVGAGLALRYRRVRGWRPGLVADAVLVALAVAAMALRVVVEPLLSTGATWGVATLAGLQSLAVAPILVAAIVVLQRGPALAPRAAVLLLAATTALAAAVILALTGDPTLPRLGGGSGLAWVAAWVLFAWSGARAREDATTSRLLEARRRIRDLLRRFLVPAAALFMAAAVADIGLRGPARPETVTVIALFGMVLALRTGRVFAMADRDARQRRQLAHTRALVDVTHSLAGTMDLDRTLRTISESARKVFGTRAAGIELVTGDGRSLETRSAIGLPDRVLGLRFPIEGSFTGWVVRHGEPRATIDPTRDPYIQPQSLDFLGRLPVAAAPIRFQGETMGALFTCIREDPFDPEELELLHALAEQAGIAIQNARLFEQVTQMSVTDPLTGLANRRQLERQLAREFAAARRGRDLAAVIFDLDDFKDYNDTYGHLAGDEAIQAFADALRAETRAMDLAARWGGDEFVALLAGTDRPGARAFVQRVRQRFGRATEEIGRGAIGVSAGVAVFRQDMADTETLLREADDALYREKPRAST